MTMRKTFSSVDKIKIVGNNTRNKFLPGYVYSMGNESYTVVKAFVADNQDMRQIRSETGELSDIPVSSMMKDHDTRSNGGVPVNKLPPDRNVVMAARARGDDTEVMESDEETENEPKK